MRREDFKEEKMNEEGRRKIEEAGRKPVEFRQKGFHCSESAFMAINEILKITDPSMVRVVTGFHGGGGTHRKEPGIDLILVLEELASGRDRRPREELPLVRTNWPSLWGFGFRHCLYRLALWQEIADQ